MYFYFGANFSAVMKINGELKGKLDNPLAFEFNDTPFIEVCSLGEEKNINFILDENFLKNGSEKVVITDLKGGYFIYFKKDFSSKGLNVLTQQNFENAIITVYEENGLKVSIETKEDFFIENIFALVKEVKIEKIFFNKELLVVSFLGEESFVSVYSLFPKIENILTVDAFKYEMTDLFITEKRVLDIKKHTVKTSWNFEGDHLKKVQEIATKNKDINLSLVNQKIIPYLFLEDFLVNDNVEEYLDDTLKEKRNLLKDYLGNFLGITPPPPFVERDKIGLIYKKSENNYFVNYISFELSNGKIINLKID